MPRPLRRPPPRCKRNRPLLNSWTESRRVAFGDNESEAGWCRVWGKRPGNQVGPRLRWLPGARGRPLKTHPSSLAFLTLTACLPPVESGLLRSVLQHYGSYVRAQSVFSSLEHMLLALFAFPDRFLSRRGQEKLLNSFFSYVEKTTCKQIQGT